MKVAINISQLSPGRPEGVVTYAKQLIACLSDICSEGELVVIKQRGLDIGKTSTKVKFIEINPPSIIERLSDKLIAASHVYLITPRAKKLAKILKINHIDIIHYPFSTIPPGELKLSAPKVLSIMDLQHEYFPELFSAIDLRNRNELFGQSAICANRIITIANFTKKTIVEKLSIPGSKIDTIHLAGDLSENPKEVPNLPNEYMLFPAADWRHKNHMRLFDALAGLKAQGFKGKLVLTGFRAGNAARLDEHIEELGLKDDVIDLGPVSFDELAYVFGRAKMLIYPTLFEGFGLPALEAMSVGLPVACSNTTSLPEIVGDAAETFNPESVDAIAASIQKVWSDDDYRATLIKRGYKQAAKFSWENTAKQTYEVYRKVYEQTK